MHELIAAPLVKAVRALSLEADEQFYELRELGHRCGIDELALQLDDQIFRVDYLVSSGQISESQGALVKQIHALLGSISGASNAAFWRPESLRFSPVWRQVRLLANEFMDHGFPD